jgi:hypothetical protein
MLHHIKSLVGEESKHILSHNQVRVSYLVVPCCAYQLACHEPHIGHGYHSRYIALAASWSILSLDMHAKTPFVSLTTPHTPGYDDNISNIILGDDSLHSMTGKLTGL